MDNRILLVDSSSMEWLLRVLENTSTPVAVDTETTGVEVGKQHPKKYARATCVTLATDEYPNIYVDNFGGNEGTIRHLKKWFEDDTKPKVLHNAKFDAHVLANHGIILRGLVGDTMVMDYLLDTSREGRHDLETCLLDWFGEEHKNYRETFSEFELKKDGTPKKKATLIPHTEWWLREPSRVMEYACKDTREGLRLFHHHKRLMEQTPWSNNQSYWDYYLKFQLPMTMVLFRMEQRGVAVDLEYAAELDEYFGELGAQAEADCLREMLRSGIDPHFVENFNPNSPIQMRELLFERFGLTPLKLTPSERDVATDASVLEAYREHEDAGSVIDAILRARAVQKLKGTYTERFLHDAPLYDGRIHTNLGQTSTLTGRLSSSGPNLQNIPVRSELGKLLRRVFVARPGNLVVGGDLSQIELRVAAHLSGDPTFLKFLMEDWDLHAKTAVAAIPSLEAEVLRKFGDVTKEALAWVKEVSKDPSSPFFNARDNGKTTNFAVQYGAGKSRAASIFGVSDDGGQAIIDGYNRAYPGMAAFIQMQHERARKLGHVRTVLRRYCHLPHAQSSSFGMRRRAERQSVNYSIQGGAADIIGLGMLLIDGDEYLADCGYELTLQIHDELLGEVPKEHAEEAAKLVKEYMSDPYPYFGLKPLKLPTPASVAVGTSWGDVH